MDRLVNIGCGLRRGAYSSRHRSVMPLFMGVFLLLFVFAFPASVVLGQTSKTPQQLLNMLPDEYNCNGDRNAIFWREHPRSQQMLVKIFLWVDGPKHPLTSPSFKLRKFMNGAMVDCPPQDPVYNILAKINNVNNYVDIPNSPWAYIELDPSTAYDYNASNPVKYELVNSINVFHIAIAYGSSHSSATSYSLFTRERYYSNPNVLKLGYSHDKLGNYKELVGDELAVCRNSSIELSARYEDLDGLDVDPFDYIWSGPGIHPADSSEVVLEDVVLPGTFTVRREGFCNFQPSRSINVEVLEPIDPIIEAVDTICQEGLVAFTVKNVKDAGAISWKIHKDGDPVGSFTPIAGMQDLPNSGQNEVTQDIMIEYATAGGGQPVGANKSITHTIQVVAENRQCEGRFEKDIVVFPALKDPVIELTPLDPSVDPTQPVCSPFIIALLHDTENAAVRAEYRWVFNNGYELPDDKPKNVTLINKTQDPETFDIQLTIDPGAKKCIKKGTYPITLNPVTPAALRLDTIDPMTGCSPVTIKATDITQPESKVASREWIYTYDGVETSWGTEKEMEQVDVWFDDYDPLKPAPTLTLNITNQSGCTSKKVSNLNLLKSARAGDLVVDGGLTQCSPSKVKVTAPDLQFCSSYYWEVRVEGETQYILQTQEKDLPAAAVSTSETFSLENNDKVPKNYEIVFHAKTPHSECVTDRTVVVTVNPSIKAELLFPVARGCPNKEGKIEVQVVDKSVRPTGATSQWTLDGNPITMDGTAPDYSFTAENLSEIDPKNVELKLQLSLDNCTSEDAFTFEILPRVNPKFEATYVEPGSEPPVYHPLPDGAEHCAPLTTKFVGEGAQNLRWRLQRTGESDAAFGTDEFEYVMRNPKATPMVYTMYLIGENDSQCRDSVQQSYTINPGVQAEIGLEVLSQCNPVEVRITSNINSGSSVTPTWNYDGGVYDAQKNVYVYSTAGTKIITLSAVNAQGCSAVAEPKSFEVPELIVAKIDADIQPSTDVCAPETVTFKNISTGATEFKWDFGDGSPVVQVVGTGPQSHEFTNLTDKTAEFTIKLIADNGFGCEDEPQSTATVNIRVFPTSLLEPSLSIEDPCNPTKVKVSTEGSSKFDKFVVDFKASDPSAGSDIHEEYPGSLKVKTFELANNDPNNFLTYTGTIIGHRTWAGGKDCPSPVKNLEAIPVPPKLKIDIEASSYEICSGEQITFTDKTEGGNIEHKWDFGDDSGEKTSNRGDLVNHVFENKTDADITYTVTITSSLKDVAGGCPDTKQLAIVVHPEVVVQFTAEVEDYCEYPLPVSFTNHSKGADPMSVQTVCEWDYGYVWEGIRQEHSTSAFDVHKYHFFNAQDNADREYVVTLNVKQQYGGLECEAKAPATRTVTVPPELKPGFNVAPNLECSPMLVDFKNTTTGGATDEIHYLWKFGDTEGDHTVVTTQHAQHEYKNASKVQQNYNATLTVTNKYGCQKSHTEVVKVLPSVQALFSISSENDCTPYDLKVHNSSSNAQEYWWELIGSGQSIPKTNSLDPFTITIDNESEEEIKEYTLQLRAVASFSGRECSDVFSLPVKVYPRVKVDPQATPLIGCNPLEVTFDGKISGLATGKWIFEPGKSSPSLSTKATFTNDDSENNKEYTVTLVAQRGDCKASKDLTITVLPFVETRFETSTLEGCSPLKVEVLNKAVSSAYQYEWTPGGGLPTSDQAQPNSFTYENTTQSPPDVQKHKLKLKTSLKANTNCSDSKEVEVTVYPSVYPAFSVKKEGCHPFQEKFVNNTIAYPGKTLWEWSFNDIPSQEQHPEPLLMNNSHTKDEVFNVTLKATSIHGCFAEVKDVVTVHPMPKALFHLKGQNESCPPFDVELINQSIGTDVTYEFDFDDGHVETRTDLSSVNYQYANTSADKQLFNIKLTATSKFNCSSNMTSTVTVFPGAVAAFDIDPGLEACSPFMVTMKNKSKNGHKYIWDFGDGKTSNMEEPAHQFENLEGADKTFDVKLTVETENECADVATKQVKVWSTPIAAFNVEPPLQVYEEPSATVTINDRTRPQVPGWNYEWTFGDGTGSVDPAPGSHEYAFWGPKEDGFMYRITLKVSNPHCQDTTSRFAFILAPVPTTDFQATAYGGCAPFDALFENLTKYADSCRWDFGDGESSTDINPVHRYLEPNIYHVKLTSWGQGGSSYAFRIIEVYENPVAKFEILPEKVMIPKATIKANNLSLGVAKSFWDFGDGNTSEEHSPVHKFVEPGEYKVKLRVESEHGCLDDTELDPGVVVLPGGKIKFPNVFSPSLDGPNGGVYDLYDMRNQVFHPVAEGVTKYTLTIYNRWGEQIFESDDINIGWDGYHLNKLCDVGVYAWRATGHFYNGEMFDLRGNVTLLR